MEHSERPVVDIEPTVVVQKEKKPSGVPKTPLSAERLQVLAAARLKAAEVRRQKAAQRAEVKDLERLEKEVERQKLTQRRQELLGKLKAQESVKPSGPKPPESVRPSESEEEEEPMPTPRPKKKYRGPPIAESSEEDDPHAMRTSYRAKVQQLKEDMVFKALFG